MNDEFGKKLDRLDELRRKFRPEQVKTEKIKQEESISERQRELMEGQSRWLKLTSSWSQEDRDWAWNYIAMCSQPYG